jgi:hypothetical protein
MLRVPPLRLYSRRVSKCFVLENDITADLIAVSLIEWLFFSLHVNTHMIDHNLFRLYHPVFGDILYAVSSST